MTGPYARAVGSRGWRVLSGRIDLDAGDYQVTATILAGEAELDVTEEHPESIAELLDPIRYLSTQRRLRLVIEADMAGMVLRFDPKNPPGNG